MIRWRVKSFASVGSTQTVAGKLGLDGAPEGTVVVAERQTAGRGRRGRVWVSPEGGLYMSLLLRPSSTAEMPTLTLVAAMAAARGIEDDTGLRTRIRWPNDVMMNGRKVSGVIAESSYHGQTLSFVTVGIGVNCSSNIPSTETKGNPTTSLAQELGHKVDITGLRQSILQAFGDLYVSWLEGADAVEAARSKISTLGKRVTIMTMSGQTLEGVAVDVDSVGGLVLKLESKRLTVHGEDVEWLRET